MQKFKERHPNYFQDYYKKNVQKFKNRNSARKSQRNFFYVIEIDGVKYCFPSKKAINIVKCDKKNLVGCENVKFV